MEKAVEYLILGLPFLLNKIQATVISDALCFIPNSWSVRTHFHRLFCSCNTAGYSWHVCTSHPEIMAVCLTQHAITNQKVSSANPENTSTCGAALRQNGSSIITRRWKIKLPGLSKENSANLEGATSQGFPCTSCSLSTLLFPTEPEENVLRDFLSLFVMFHYVMVLGFFSHRVSNVFIWFAECGAWELESVENRFQFSHWVKPTMMLSLMHK